MDKEREAFEAWFTNENSSTAELLLHRNAFGEYISSSAHWGWMAWQARAKQTITLPVKDATGEH